MDCIEITSEMKNFHEIAEIQTAAFPLEECYPIDKILSLSSSSHIMYQSFWEGEQLCGIIFYNIGKISLYLFYLAVHATVRSNGYGTAILQWLKNNYPDKSIIANIEPTDVESDNKEQRRKRFLFYERNGFSKTNYRLSDDSGLYDIISTAKTFDAVEYMQLIRELGFDDYHPRLIPVS